MKAFLRFFALVVTLLTASHVGAGPAGDPENTLYLDTVYGRVVIQMRPDLAPKTVAQIKTLTRRGFYNGLPFHRVIAGFMAQTGDPTGTGTGGSGHKLKAEFSREHFVRGTVAMAHAADPDSADSQFFIMYGPRPGFQLAEQLCPTPVRCERKSVIPPFDGKYTVWGQVISGMEFLDSLKHTNDPADNGKVPNPDKIVKMQVAADADGKAK